VNHGAQLTSFLEGLIRLSREENRLLKPATIEDRLVAISRGGSDFEENTAMSEPIKVVT